MLLHITSAHSWKRTTFSPLSAHFLGYVSFLSPESTLLIFPVSRHPNAITSLANRIYNSIPKASIESLQLIHQERAQYNERRIGLTHPQVTKADLMLYLESVHEDHAAFLNPIGDLEVPDDGWMDGRSSPVSCRVSCGRRRSMIGAFGLRRRVPLPRTSLTRFMYVRSWRLIWREIITPAMGATEGFLENPWPLGCPRPFWHPHLFQSGATTWSIRP
jgi:hypothetical protein